MTVRRGWLESFAEGASQGSNLPFRENDIGVAHHEIDVFVTKPRTNRHLGCLHNLGTYPKSKKQGHVRVAGGKGTRYQQRRQECHP